MNERFLSTELHKVVREIKTHGRTYIFNRNVLDEYNEPTGQEQEITTVRGLFHITKGYVSQKIAEGSKTHSKGQPMLMLTYEDSTEIKVSDFVNINENKYIVIEKNNLQELNIVCDISLELVLDGEN